ncbi:TPA: hypothetical protein CPT80_00400 [Candidatus Gastranaerophilales bacterium HUM_9]|nr:MAG TPA: hypothetical protein CPT80_00400 [Candidatus Gastranaerophilales bacterium HUM_9]HBX35505.1 hypothetical protein [Cyanobacteria bacterium UBA11440]
MSEQIKTDANQEQKNGQTNQDENVVNQTKDETTISNNENSQKTETDKKDENPTDNKSDLILGKFKNYEDLKMAYQNLQKQQGEQSVELGNLRKLKQVLQEVVAKQKEEEAKELEKQEYVNNYLAKYDNENYFQNDAFKNLYSEAFQALGTNLDTDLFVQKLEDYVLSRIMLKEQLKNAQDENKSATDSLSFSKGETKKSDKKLRFQDIPPEELDKYIAKYV